MKLLLVRHGESTWNAEGRYQGRKDPPLSARGALQAKALAERLSGSVDLRPNAIASSPLARARRTAETVAEKLACGVTIDERLIEISHGAWEGLLRTEIQRRWPDMMAAWRSAPDSVTFPGGESLADVQRRWQSFASDVARFPSPLLIVTHDVIVRLAVLQARNEPLAAFGAFASENAALSEFTLDGDRLQLDRLNDRSHLGDLTADPTTQAL